MTIRRLENLFSHQLRYDPWRRKQYRKARYRRAYTRRLRRWDKAQRGGLGTNCYKWVQGEWYAHELVWQSHSWIEELERYMRKAEGLT